MIDVCTEGGVKSYDFKFNAWGGKFKSSKDDAINLELAKIYFEDILGKSLNLFIDEKRTPALGHHIDDIELL